MSGSCHLKEMDVIVCVWQLLYLRVSPVSTSVNQLMSPVSSRDFRLDSLQPFPELWFALWPQNVFSQWSGSVRWRSSHCPPLLLVRSAVRTHKARVLRQYGKWPDTGLPCWPFPAQRSSPLKLTLWESTAFLSSWRFCSFCWISSLYLM